MVFDSLSVCKVNSTCKQTDCLFIEFFTPLSRRFFMKFTDRYPIIVTDQKNACRDFWVQHLGLQVGFDSQWFVWLTAEDGSASIAFMSLDHPSAPPGPQPFSGLGMCFELQTENVDVAHAQFVASGGSPTYPLTDEAFGQRRFGFADPSGLWIDVVEQTEPQAGYWDRYTQTPS
jgi:catechol 2,3-dioxygenase-like lactoylglutathione lyase family enzyme